MTEQLSFHQILTPQQTVSDALCRTLFAKMIQANSNLKQIKRPITILHSYNYEFNYYYMHSPELTLSIIPIIDK